MNTKTITVLVPTYNEEANIDTICERVGAVFRDKLPRYDYHILFIDNDSKDGTRELIRRKAADNPAHVRAIFNARNFGGARSMYYGLTHAGGDAVVLLFADLQDPPEIIEDFVAEWERGAKIVAGIKSSSGEGKIMYAVRTLYYWLIRKMSYTSQLEHFTGFGLYDRSFIDVLSQIEDSDPYLRGIVGELGFHIARVEYRQEVRQHGKSSNNFFRLYDTAMQGFTSYTKAALRMATFVGIIMGVISFLLGVSTLIVKLASWNFFPVGIAAISIAVFFMGSVQLFFMGLLGEYILSMNTRSLKRPLVIEEERINFD